MKRSVLFFLHSILLISVAFAQKQVDVHTLEKKNTDPPPYPVRTMAEWEEAQAVVITWVDNFSPLLTEITRAAIEEVNVIIVAKENMEEEVKLHFIEEGVALDHILFLNKSHNSIWVRDYGPWSVYGNDVGGLNLVDWIYNRDRPNDDKIPAEIAEMFSWPFHEASAAPNDLIHAGGNHLGDGFNTAFSSDLIQLENPTKTEEKINEIAYDFLGIQRYFKLPRLPYDVIHHLDMHMRFIDEETLLIGEYPEGIADGPTIESNIEYIKSHCKTPFGNPYNIIRIPMPPDGNGHYPDDGGDYRTYTNSLVVNRTVLVPTYEEQYDTTALRIYSELFPGYLIKGVDCNNIIKKVGAIHCVTKLIGGEDPLLITFPKFRNTTQTSGSYPIKAIVKHESGIVSATLHYRLQGEMTFNVLLMTNVNAVEELYYSAIPAFPSGSTIEYFIKATAVSGKVQFRPMVAPDGFFSFEVQSSHGVSEAVIYQDNTVICDGAFVHFTGSYSLGASDYLWHFPGGEPSVSIEKNPTVYYYGVDSNDVQLIVTNVMGSDTLQLSNAVSFQAFSKPYLDDFSTDDSAWKVKNPNEGTDKWELVAIGDTCDQTSNVLRINNYGENKSFERDFLVAGFDLDRYRGVRLVFDVAYSGRKASPSYLHPVPDELRVNITTCDGEKLTIYDKSGDDLRTLDPMISAFEPESCEDWRHVELDLSSYDGQLITIEFENICFKGNYLFLDNIEIKGDKIPNKIPNVLLSKPKKDLTVYTNELPYIQSINAIASDIDGVITKVDFRINTEVIKSIEEAPYLTEYELSAYGTYDIQAVAYDDEGGVKYSKTNTIEIKPDKIPLDTQLEIYPNPVSNILKLSLGSNKDNLLSSTLWTLDGKEVYRQKWTVYQGVNEMEISVRKLSSGMYYLTLTAPDWTIFKKVVIVK